MDATSTLALITIAFTTFGSAVLVILGLVIGIGVGYLVFRFGWRKVGESVGYRVGTSDEYPKEFRNAFIDSVKKYSKSNP